MWLESETAKYFEANANRYDIVVAISSDVWLAFPITRRDVVRALQSRTVLHSDNHEAGGYTNAFLFGAPRLVAAVMSRFSGNFFPEENDYEHQLKRGFEAAGVASGILTKSLGTMKSLAKIRHSGAVFGASPLDQEAQHCVATFMRKYGLSHPVPAARLIDIVVLFGFAALLIKMTHFMFFDRPDQKQAVADFLLSVQSGYMGKCQTV